MLYPLLPVYLVSVLGASPRALGVIEGLVEALASLTRIASGWASDRLGNRTRLTTAGYAMSGLGKLIIAVAGAWPLVLLGRAVDRLGKGVRTAPRDALVAEVTPADMRGRAFGFHKMMDTLGAVLGVLAAYALARAGTDTRTAVMIAMVPAVVGVLVIALVPEPPPRPDAGIARRPRVSVARAWSLCPGKLKFFLAIVLLFALGSSSNQFLLLRAKDLGFGEADVVLLYLVYNISYLVMSYPAGRVSDRWGRRPLLVAGYVIYAASYAAFALADGIPTPAVWGLFAFYGLYIGLTDGVEKALVADMAPPQARATVLGMHAAVTAAGLLPASVLAGWFYDAGRADLAFWFGAGCALAAAILARWVL
jgi:MFS family permease